MFKIERIEGKLEITTPYSSSFVTAIKKTRWKMEQRQKGLGSRRRI